MPVTLRRRCHYCGNILGAANRRENRIHCDKCLADNFFDEDDNIIDTPVEEVHSKLTQSSEVESESSIFCKTCLTNQSFYVTALGDYLPDDDDPRYAELEAALPTFKKELDLRFPRCCANCAPRVEAQIKQANYQAKSDHVRRMMMKSHARAAGMQFGPRNILVTAAGVGYTYSLLTQLFWHGLASQTEAGTPILGLSLRQCLDRWPVPGECSTYAASLIPTSLLVGLLCIWWNPHWQQRLKGREGRLVGLRRYYSLQVMVLMVRFAVWIVAKDFAFIQLQPQILHVVALVMITMFSIFALLGTITLDTTPLVDWTNIQQPLVSPNQFRPPPAFLPTPDNSQTSNFNIANMAGPSQDSLQAWRPPTPPDVEGGMDWTPTSNDFKPRPRVTKQKFEQPSPFHGNLPAAPSRGIIYNNRAPPPAAKQSLGIAPGFFGLSKAADGTAQNPISAQTISQPQFAPATFFAHQREADTGLENIFDKMFSVRDSRDAQVNAVRKQPPRHSAETTIFDRSPRRRSRAQSTTLMVRKNSLGLTCTIIAVLTVTISILCTKEVSTDKTSTQPYQVLPYTFLIPFSHEAETLFYTGTFSPRTVLISSIELIAPALGVLCLPRYHSPFIPSWNKVVIGILCLFLLLEIYNFIQLQNSPVSAAATAQMLESINKAEQEMFEESAISHPSPPRLSQPFDVNTTPRPAHNPPTPIQYPPANYSPIRKRDSDESIASTTSIQTSSTAAGWKTPKSDSRNFDWQNSNRQPSSNMTRGFGGLSLSNDFGSGTNITGPRNIFGKYR